MSDKEFLDEILAREELERRGYKREKCPACGDKEIMCGYGKPLCITCDDQRYIWTAPKFETITVEHSK